MRRAILVMSVLVLAGCSSSGDPEGQAGGTYTMHLTVANTSLDGSQPAQVKDANGTVVGAETLLFVGDCLMKGCTAEVDIPDLPESTFYEVTVGKNAFPLTTTASFSDLEANGWNLTMRP